MKRFRLSKIAKWSKLPKWIKTEPAPPNGLQISKVLLATTIVLPLMLVGSDMVSDGSVLGQMWSYTGFVKDLVRAYSVNQAAAAAVKLELELEFEQEDDSDVVEAVILFALSFVSIVILVFSTVNLLVSNPLASLLRNARTTVMMNSRELERKNVPVPLGNS